MSFLIALVSIALLGAMARATHCPFIFPSIGPTVFLFVYAPTDPSASPRNTLIGHAVGLLAGYLSLHVTGLQDRGAVDLMDPGWLRIFAAGLSLGATAALMVLLRAPHPPAGATTLIVSLGILTRPWQLAVMLSAVGILTVLALAVCRLLGIPYPWWSVGSRRALV